MSLPDWYQCCDCGRPVPREPDPYGRWMTHRQTGRDPKYWCPDCWEARVA